LKQKIADILLLLTQKAVDVYPEPDPLAGMEQLEFYGQSLAPREVKC
jgi:hypothetical protein